MDTNEADIKKIYNLAIKSHRENNLIVAEKLYNQILKINSSHFDANFYLASLYAQKNNLVKSKELFKKAIKIQPKYALSYSNLGAVLKELNEFEEAIEVCEKAVKIDPNNVSSLINLGAILKELGRFKEAISACEQAIKIDSKNVMAHQNLALALIELGKIHEAINCYNKLGKIESNYEKYYGNLGQLNIVLGNNKEAIKFYQLATKHEPEKLNNYYYLSGLDKKILNTYLKEIINKILLKDKQNYRNLAFANFLLSKYEANLKNYENEFNYLLKGHSNFLAAEKKEYRNDIEYWLNVLPNNEELNKLKILNKKVQNQDSIKPIFIVGVPRSGSTLVEKIITSGSEKVIAGEEMGILSILVKRNVIKKESIYKDIKKLKLTLMERYRQRKLIQDKDIDIFTDKTLDNFFYIGLIKEIFPNAKVINCKRTPIASIMSILKNNLPAIPWTHNLEHIFKYFDIYYKTIANYEKKIPNFIYSLDYEKLVNEPEIESKKLMKFCDLPWDKKCLEFYKRKDLISKTASNIQIRQKIYKDSPKKYLPYKKFFDEYGKKYSWFNII